MSSRQDLIMSLGKVVVAAAWADHDLNHEEVNSLKDLLFHLPDLNAAEWSELEIYMHSPVGEAERERLIEDLRQQIHSEADRQFAQETLEALVQADGEVSGVEKAVLDEINAVIENADLGILGGMKRLVAGAIGRREAALEGRPNREVHLEDFVKNRIFYSLRRRLHLDEGELSLRLPQEDLRRLSLAGGLLARVAHLDREVTEDEFEAIAQALRDSWRLSEQAAAFVAEVSVSEVAEELDGFRLTREFFEATDAEGRAEFVEALFKVAAADGQASHEEIEEIRRIALGLKLTHRQFIDAKLTLPKEARAS